jgi:hypothetical protein
MSTEVIVHKDRTNSLEISLGFDITGETITSQIRSEPDTEAPLIMEWSVSVVDATSGELLLTVDNVDTADIKANSGFMDLKRVSGGEPLAIFDHPIEVRFVGSVTE